MESPIDTHTHCAIWGESPPLMSEVLGLCPDCARAEGMSAQELADCANPRTYCVCYFGGDPASQMPHALASARQLAARDVVVCWETAGTSHPRLLDRAVTLSLETGGCIKFDLKAHTEALHIVLTGWSNRRTLENFTRAGLRNVRIGNRHLLGRAY